MKVYRCLQCGFEYDEAQGWEEEGFPPEIGRASCRERV